MKISRIHMQCVEISSFGQFGVKGSEYYMSLFAAAFFCISYAHV